MKSNKWTRAAIPALLLHCSIGTVYCWSTFSQEVANYTGYSKGAIEWAFSLAIFFLGMSAAFLGSIVENNIKKSSLIATICFTVGMIGTGLSIHFKSLIGIYIFYGVIMGIGLGTGYLSPVKTLMLWFDKNKGLATGLAVAGFGLAKAIATPIMQFILTSFNNNPAPMFYIMGGIYFVMMFIGHLLLKKPDNWVEEKTDVHIFKSLKENVKVYFTNKTFIGIWLMFYINIACGLALISQEKGMLLSIGTTVEVAALVGVITAVANALGRLFFSWVADGLKSRNTIYKVIFIMSIVLTALALFSNSISNKLFIVIVALLIGVNAGYGGGFSNCPTLLSDHFGMDKISSIHGLCLSAWAIAGLTGNQLSSFILRHSGTYANVFQVTGILYCIALAICIFIVGNKKKA